LEIWKSKYSSLKRIRLGHLPDEATLEQYNAIVTSVVNSRDATVYLYVFRDRETIYFLGNRLDRGGGFAA
jgi:hypothetical protein